MLGRDVGIWTLIYGIGALHHAGVGLYSPSNSAVMFDERKTMFSRRESDGN